MTKKHLEMQTEAPVSSVYGIRPYRQESRRRVFFMERNTKGKLLIRLCKVTTRGKSYPVMMKTVMELRLQV